MPPLVPEVEPQTLSETGTVPEQSGPVLDLVARDSLPFVGFGLGLLYLLLCAGDLALRPVAVAGPMAAAAGLTAVLFLALSLVLRRRRLPPRYAHALGFAVYVVVLGNNALGLGLSAEIHQSTSFLLTIVGVAFVLPRTAWFAAALVTSLGLWTAVALSLPPTPLHTFYAFGVVVALALSSVLHRVRRSTIGRLEAASLAEREREEEMREVFALSRDLQCMLDAEGRVRRTNPAMAQCTGLGVPQLEGRPFASLVVEEDRRATADELERLTKGAGHVSFENRLLTAGGQTRWVVWDVVALDVRGAVHAAGRDVTVRRKLETELRLSRAALESAASGIVITDRQGMISWVNPAFTRMTGWGAEEVDGKTPRLLKSGRTDPAVYRDLWATIASGLVWRGEIVNRRKDGTLYTEELIIAPVRDGKGEITHYVAVKNDVTERRAAEELLRRNAELMQRELDLAGEVQAGLVPRGLPSLEGFEVAARARPARWVSGDLYDWVPLGGNACLFVMADISGKGVSAAMLSAATRSLLRSLAPQTRGPGELLSRLNRVLYAELDATGMFITVFALLLDSRRGLVSYANAGHTRALVARGGRPAETLPATGLPVGVTEDLDLEEKSLVLLPGDALLVYSDGVTEAERPGGGFYGRERLERVFADLAGGDVRGIVIAVDEDVRRFCGEVDPSDDVTLLALGALPCTLRWNVAARLESVAALVEDLGAAAGRYGERYSGDVRLLASELLGGIVVHGYRGGAGEIRVEAELGGRGLTLEIWDDAPPGRAAAGAPPVSDYGLPIVRKLTSVLEHEAVGEVGNHWKVVPAAGAGE